MDLIQKSDLKELIAREKGWCVSIYLSTHRRVTYTLDDQIRFKNMFRQAEGFLLQKGVPKLEVEKMLKPLQAVLGDTLFFQHQGDGLAFFLSAETLVYYRLPLVFEELVVVSNHFHLKPLLPIVMDDGQFYVLAISQNKVRLLQSSRYSCQEIKVKGMPESLAETIQHDIYEPHLQFHSGVSSRMTKGGKRGSICHLQAEDIDDFKINIGRFFQQVNQGLHNFLKEAHSPLVLACVEYQGSIYRQVNTYPYLVEDSVPGNPELLTAEELRFLAWPLVEPFFRRKQEEAMKRYNQLAKTEKVSNKLESIVPAAHHGRVDSLFVAVGVQKWGIFDSINEAVELHPKEIAGDDDLLNLAAFHTLLHGGTVYAVHPGQLPDQSLISAIFRY
ncbi:MAG: hypothetical protein ABII74_02930 [Elusimicrobiota bacterium]